MELEIELGPAPVKLRRNSPGAEDVLVLPVSGPRGPTGPAGGDPYIHTQSSASASWIVNHNLGRVAHVTIVIDNAVVLADITHSSDDQLTITFASPTSGTAYLI